MYRENIKKLWWSYLIELVVAIFLINWDLKIFLIYAYLLLGFKIGMTADYLRKLIRVFQVGNETKIMAIARKLKVTDKEIADILEETKGNVTEEDWASVEKDFKDLSRIEHR